MLFVLLEVICLFLIKSSNNYHSEALNNSSSAIVGWTMEVVGKAGDFFDQSRQTEDLAHKYAEQTTLLSELRQKEEQFYLSKLDESKIYQYKFIPAKVTKNSIFKDDNYITIDKGTEQGVRPGMGVMSPDGLVGIVYASSDNFSTVTSVLHSKKRFSARIRSNKVIGSIKWDGKSPRFVKLLDILRHERFIVGDTVETSGFGSRFPPGIPIGYISSQSLKVDDKAHDITVKLSTDMASLHHVLVINNKLQEEQLELESNIGDLYGE